MSVNQAEVQALAAPMSMAERWASPSSIEGGYLLTDPLTGQRIDTQRPPVWIADDHLLAGGLSYLRHNASNLDLTIFFGAHEFAEDLGDPQKGWYERQVVAADFHGFEAMNRTAEVQQRDRSNGMAIVQAAMAQNQPPRLEHFLSMGPKIGCSSFEMRQMAARTLIRTPSFAVDIKGDGVGS